MYKRQIVDTNSDPESVDFVIPANDDASKSIEIILDSVIGAMAEGLEERKIEKIDQPEDKEEGAQGATPGKRRRVRRNDSQQAPAAAPAAAAEPEKEAAE